MQPPVKRSRRKGRRSSRKSTGDRQASGIIAGGYATATLAALADDSHNYLRSSGGSRSDGLTRNVLSGRLSICSPVFNPSSEMVLCACSSSVLGLNVETGEQLVRLDGHAADVTGMLLLPTGVYGGDDEEHNHHMGEDDTAGRFKRASPGRPLLTSSLDGTLRLWDISVDPLSLEDRQDRCLHIFRVGRPVRHLYLGGQDSTGAALDVLVVTNKRHSLPQRLEKVSTDVGRADGDPSPPPPGVGMQHDGGSEHDKDLDGGEEEEDDNKGEDTEDDGVDTGDEDDGVDASKPMGLRKKKPLVLSRRGERGGGFGIFNREVTRFGIAPGVSSVVILEVQSKNLWVAAVSSVSPLVGSSGSSGGSRAAASCPVLLIADGRDVTAVDAGTGDEAIVLRVQGIICSMVVGEGGESLVTGHTDGSMAHCEGLQERIGAAFGVSGYQKAEKQPAINMHWHSSPVRCMSFASDRVQLFSGGEEAVLVQWNLSKGTKAFLPRLGATLQELTVSPSQEHLVVSSSDNAVTLVGLAEWDVQWQLRGLALNRSQAFKVHESSPSQGSALKKEAFSIGERMALRLTVEPKRGLLACNGRAGHVQFYNMATDCLEASAEIERFNRNSFAATVSKKRLKSKADAAVSSTAVAAAAAGSEGPMVEYVAFSHDGKRMAAVASRLRAAGTTPIPRLSFWKHAVGSDPYKNPGYVGSYAGARSSRGNVSGGTFGHWAPDTSVDNPHGPGKALSALEYHPREDVVVTAGEDGGFNLWGLKKSADLGGFLAAMEPSSSSSRAVGQRRVVEGVDGKEESAVQNYHWACSLSVRYKEGFSATGVSFSSDGSLLAVAYNPVTQSCGKATLAPGNADGQGVITLWSLDTITLLFTLLLPRPRQHPLSSTPSSLPRPLKSMTMPLALTFLAQSGRILACGDSYAAVWDLLSEEPKPLWEYRAHFLAAAAVDTGSVSRSGKTGVYVEGRGFGDVALCVQASSLPGKTKKKGSIVLLLNSRQPTPLYAWRLPRDIPSCVRLLLCSSAPDSDGKEGVVCLTREGELLLLSVAVASSMDRKGGSAGDGSAPWSTKLKVGALHGLGLVRSKDGVTAPVLHGANAARQKLLDVDLAAFDKVVSVRGTARKRREVSGGVAGDGPEGEDHDDVDDGHAGGREVELRSGQRSTDILDPSSLNLAPVSDLYEPFMKTLLKPAPQSSQKAWEAHPLVTGQGKKQRLTTTPTSTCINSTGVAGGGKMKRVGVDEGLLEVLMEELKAGGPG